jgi:hypothetical protein
MKLGKLAFACHVFGLMSDYDSSYKQFLDSTRPTIDLMSNVHLIALLKWLNAWGCRQFAVEYHELAAKKIKEWYGEFNQHLLPANVTILTMTDENIMMVERVYAGLVTQTASYKKLPSGQKVRIKVGPTGTAKILFALRPNALIPWDAAMREELSLDGSNHSYGDYLRKVRSDLEEISIECQRNGLEFMDLPIKLGRPNSSITKLIDEYHWVTITRKCPTPSKEKLKAWMDWS